MNDKLCKRNFFLLVIFSALVFTALFFMFDNLQASFTKPLDSVRKQKMLENSLHWVETSNHKKILKTNRWMRAFIKSDKLVGAKVLTTKLPLRQQGVLSDLNQQFRYAIPLDHGRWLNIIFHRGGINTIIAVSDIVIIILLITLLIAFYYWLIQSMHKPLKYLKFLADDLSTGMGRIKFVNANIPEIKSVVQAVNQLQADIRKLMNDRTQTLAAISHDLRTPITRLKLRLEAFEDAPQFEKLMADLAEMERMIDSVLGFVRDQSEEEAVNFDLSALLETVVDDMSDAGFDVRVVKMDSSISFFGQIHALKRAFTNLIDNAIKYGESAGISLSKENNEIIFSVDDKGPGIRENEMEKVFQPFYRIDKSRNLNTGGAGLGLVITKNIIEQNKGCINLRNLKPNGLRVQVRFLYA